MKTENVSVILRRMLVVAGSALLLAVIGCGPDCDGLCNDGIDLCNRIAACDPDHCEQVGVSCLDCEPRDLDLEACIAECDGASGDLKKEAEKALEEVAADLTAAGC